MYSNGWKKGNNQPRILQPKKLQMKAKKDFLGKQNSWEILLADPPYKNKIVKGGLNAQNKNTDGNVNPHKTKRTTNSNYVRNYKR